MKEALIELARDIETRGVSLARSAMSDAPWADQYQQANMAQAAQCFTVAAALRARAA